MNTEEPTFVEADYQVMPDGQIESAGPQKKKRGLVGSIIAGFLYLVSKFKFIFTALKGVKFLGTGATALASAGAYALAFGWQFGIGLVVLLFVHEMGHVVALKRYGVRASAPIFVPFLGAFIGMKQLPKDAKMEAVVGLGGPVLGSIGAFVAWGLYAIYGHDLFLIMAYLGILLNLFNLLPILPLDGGRAVGAMSRWFWVVGGVGMVALLVFLRSPILLLILLFGAPEIMHRIRNRKSEQQSDYYSVTWSERLAVGATYFGLILVLGFSLYQLGPLIAENQPG